MDFLKVYSSYPYNKIRAGKKNDGGYVICEGFKYDLLLSCGVNDDISFEEYFVPIYDIECYAFDGTIDKFPPTENKKINWIKKNIGEFESETTTNLKNFINSHKNIFLKMDIESYEFGWLRQMTCEELSNIAQIAIEFHFPFTDTSKTNISILDKNVELFSDKIDCLKKLSETHYLIHFHGNNCCGTTIFENIIVPNVFECTYLRKDFFKCTPFRNTISIPDKNLDSQNIKYKNDIILKSYPFVDKKTVIFACTHNVKNLIPGNIGVNMWGLGDVLRGMISVYKCAKKNNCYYYIDIQNHVLSKFLNPPENPYENYIKEKSNNIYFMLSDMDGFISRYNKNNPMYFMTNLNFGGELSIDDKQYFKTFLTPNNTIKEKINTMMKDCPFENYNVVHCRLKDSEFTQKNKNSYYSSICDKISKYFEKNTIFVSNSWEFKKFIKNTNPNVFQFDIKPAHLGNESSNCSNLCDTICEFFILSKSKKIYTYSEYEWTSGFVERIKDIYDVPIFNIKAS